MGIFDFTPPNYTAPLYLRSGHVNTIVSSLITTSSFALQGERELVTYSDGNATSVYVHQQQSPWVVLSFHGLGGSVESDFVSRVVRAGIQHKITTVAVNHRNSGDALLLSKVPYHSGKAQDISDLVKWARGRFPDKKIAVIGYSMSANMILNLRAERFGTEQPDYAVAINPPVDLRYSSIKLTNGFSKIYGQKFVNELREIIHQMIHKKIISAEYSIPKSANLIDVDEIFTAPLNGFNNANHYYQVASSLPHLEQIKERTMIIAAEDDPFIKFDELKKMSFHKNVRTHFFPNGGHVGFALSWKKKWSDDFLKEFFLSFGK